VIINISGPSGSGKTTITNYLVKKYPLIYNKLISYTSRDKRPKEQFDIDYHFVKKSFLKNEGDFVLKRDRKDGFYAIKKEDLVLGNDKILLTTLPPKGVLKIEELGFVVKCFYLLVPPIECRKRMVNRGDKINKIRKRLSADKKESDLSVEREILYGRPIFVLDGSKSINEIGSLIHKMLFM
jgi:guanylate kinase